MWSQSIQVLNPYEAITARQQIKTQEKKKNFFLKFLEKIGL